VGRRSRDRHQGKPHHPHNETKRECNSAVHPLLLSSP
jgi:hypothetical protein